ncbi:hypothetical protein EYC84_006706 [Monilinia fructicola]|uniref:Uncharacterized protein n=1 Tax=Monilinia fructicola TaxID=38448 RepID=A0A5M9K7Z7_MONFR|nr:hypothetical protein EYC84_006706 [Monilinia fructicola]
MIAPILNFNPVLDGSGCRSKISNKFDTKYLYHLKPQLDKQHGSDDIRTFNVLMQRFPGHSLNGFSSQLHTLNISRRSDARYIPQSSRLGVVSLIQVTKESVFSSPVITVLVPGDIGRHTPSYQRLLTTALCTHCRR